MNIDDIDYCKCGRWPVIQNCVNISCICKEEEE